MAQKKSDLPSILGLVALLVVVGVMVERTEGKRRYGKAVSERKETQTFALDDSGIADAFNRLSSE
jgi:hypothetical protein